MNSRRVRVHEQITVLIETSSSPILTKLRWLILCIRSFTMHPIRNAKGTLIIRVPFSILSLALLYRQAVSVLFEGISLLRQTTIVWNFEYYMQNRKPNTTTELEKQGLFGEADRHTYSHFLHLFCGRHRDKGKEYRANKGDTRNVSPIWIASEAGFLWCHIDIRTYSPTRHWDQHFRRGWVIICTLVHGNELYRCSRAEMSAFHWKQQKWLNSPLKKDGENKTRSIIYSSFYSR